MLKASRPTQTIALLSGPAATITSLVGKHQRILTDPRKKQHEKMNEILADVLLSVEGVDLKDMAEHQKIRFVESMLSGDRARILSESRQLSMGREPVFIYTHEWKDGEVKKEEQFEIHLIDEDNQDIIIENVLKAMGSPEDPEVIDFVKRLNGIGSFPTRPYLMRYDSYEDVLAAKRITFRGVLPSFPDYEFDFSLLDGRLERGVKPKEITSHTLFLARKIRYRKISIDDEGKNSNPWRALTSGDLDNFPLGDVKALKTLILSYEGDVDSVEIMDNPDPNGADPTIKVDLMAQVDFFFPSGRL